MKSIQSLIQKLAAAVAAVAVFGLSFNAMAETGPEQLSAQVIRLDGDARASSDGQTWHSVKIGDVLRPGTVIQTGDKSIVDLLLGSGGNGGGAKLTSVNYNPTFGGSSMYSPEEKSANVVRVFESSVLAIDKLSKESTAAGDVEETQLDLRAGQILGNVKKLSSASKYEVKIPNGVAGIRGTTYLISSSGVVDVVVGSVVIATVAADGSVVTRVVSAGNQWDPITGQITAIPDATMIILKNNPLTSPQTGVTVTPLPQGPIIVVSPLSPGDH